jgi:hypothetical protein
MGQYLPLIIGAIAIAVGVFMLTRKKSAPASTGPVVVPPPKPNPDVQQQ